ncbi:dynamin family protein [Colletotrichum graminicola]|uniref:Dynamin family protein n=1 Tax=Colletotrichum graminicola (strain M1.001 / M2 / FGSC 10212) TaxID=645133 RepID=E3Q3V1_COLGM|nr:dynamin family protein [Colletotrichum graminicola M1.001]EFQ25703.1 dynamin family protein [Colletotrichum graminicola M1.001]WDK10946.1 dynamin family protein [Colletotrichum graminicola]
MDQIDLDSTALGELNSVETRTLFDTIDKLSMLGVGRIVNLPQIIVVGDQSSGKSSVLEAISHIHFPSEANVCTRFATELVLCPGSRRRVTATVLFADIGKPAHELQVTDFKQEDIDNIISTAKQQMGVSDTGRDFSKDVLRLEVEGPGLYPLTLVDLPGIFHTAGKNQSEAGKETVMELMRSYMKKKNSIILAIVSAGNLLVNQAVLEEAKKFDPTKKRTLGVITKPDLLHPGSANEQNYLQIIRGREECHNLSLGWHVLRNKADYEEGTGTRDEVEEQFLNSGAWASIPKADKGVGALRKKLSQILLTHFKQNLPTVTDDIENKLKEREDELKRLGQPRSTPADMRAYLIDIAGGFQKIVQDGIEGHYKDPFFGGLEGTQQKFRSQLRNFNRAIRQVLLDQGANQRIIQSFGDIRRQHTIPKHLQSFINAHQYNLRTPEVIIWTELATQLERQAADNQGTEFPGYANMDLMIQLFQKQSEPWGYIAEKHVGHVSVAAKAFVDQIFEHVIGPSSKNNTTDAILSTCVDPFFEKRDETLAEKVKEILRPFKQGYAMPLDADFQEAMEARMAGRTAGQGEWVDNTSFSLGRTNEPQSTKEFGTDRIIDTMQTFYDMALRTFTENLINLVVESCLIRELPSIFTPKDVNLMSDERLAELAAESEEVSQRREQLQHHVALLRKGLEQCRRYKPRVAVGTGQGGREAPYTPKPPSKVSTHSESSSNEKAKKADASPNNKESSADPPDGKTGLFGSIYTPPTTGLTSSIFSNAPKSSVRPAFSSSDFLSFKVNNPTVSANQPGQSGIFGSREPASSTAAGSTATSTGGLTGGLGSGSPSGTAVKSSSSGGIFGSLGSTTPAGTNITPSGGLFGKPANLTVPSAF